MKPMNGYRRLATILRALGHPVRLQIVEELLREGEACVCHLEHALGQRQAYISQQLARLREAGLVVDRREGMNVFYALADESFGPLMAVARKTALSLDDRLSFSRPPSAGGHSPCPCPRCQEKEKVALG
jgi:ArsR family transcriptional regulator